MSALTALAAAVVGLAACGGGDGAVDEARSVIAAYAPAVVVTEAADTASDVGLPPDSTSLQMNIGNDQPVASLDSVSSVAPTQFALLSSPVAGTGEEASQSTMQIQPAAATPTSGSEATGKVGNFFIRHSFPDIEAAATPISLAYLNTRPAGSTGRITVSGGHLAVAGERIRLYGINLSHGAFLPAKDQAAKLAARLAKEGFNAVRLAGLDMPLAVDGTVSTTHRQQGILNADQTFNAEALDRLDFFVSQLQAAGLYVTIPLHLARRYKEAADCIGSCEGLDNYLSTLIASQQSYASQLLTHVNPYTKVAYKDDPGVFAIEINNENSLTHRWANGTIDSYLTNAAFKIKYGEPLNALWRDWVQRKYSTLAATAKAWSISTPSSWTDISAPLRANAASASTALYADWLDFMATTEQSYKQAMYVYLKNTLGVKALVYDTQASYSQPFARDGMDLTDLHSYFGDLGTPTGKTNTPGNGRPVFQVENRSALSYADIKDAGAFGIFDIKTVGRPNIISEFTYRDGNQYAAEAELLMTALAGFQDIDALFLWDYHSMNLYTNRQTYPGWYNMTVNAVTRIPAVLAFRRGDMQAGAPQILKKTRKSFLDLTAQRKAMTSTNFHFGGDVRMPYVANMYTQVVDTAAEEQVVGGRASQDNGASFITSTNEMTWRPLDRIVVNTPRSRQAIGYFSNTSVTLGAGVEVNVGKTLNRYAVMALTSLVDSEVLPASKMLFTIAGHFTVPGEYPRKPGDRLYSWGDDVPRIEAVPSTVRITTPANVTVTALDSTGARKSTVPVVRNGAVIEFATGPAYDTGWYLIETK